MVVKHKARADKKTYLVQPNFGIAEGTIKLLFKWLRDGRKFLDEECLHNFNS